MTLLYLGHVITLIHLGNGRATVDCRSRGHGDPPGWFHMNILEADAGRVIALHRDRYAQVAPSTLGSTDG